MAQTYEPQDKVVVTAGPDAGRSATVVDNFRMVYGDDLTDGALVRINDGVLSNAAPERAKSTSRRGIVRPASIESTY